MRGMMLLGYKLVKAVAIMENYRLNIYEIHIEHIYTIGI